MNPYSRKVLGLAAGVFATALAPTFVGVAPLAGAAPSTTTATTANPIRTQVTTLAARQLLQSTLDRYAALTSYRAEGTWQRDTTVAGKTQSSSNTRTVVYAKPNKIHATSVMPDLTSTFVSDGAKIVQYTSKLGANAYENKALPSVNGMGSLLVFQLLGDAAGRTRLVPANTPVVDKPGVTIEGVPCRVISFVAGGQFGNTELAIGLNDGMVHRISYDFAPLVTSLKGQENAPEKMQVTETYKLAQANVPVTDADFSTALPTGVTLAPPPAPQKEPGPPVPIGQMAPDFSVMPVGATTPVKLSAFKGQVVMLDFWATWCPPCRKSLPETNRLSTAYGDKGLKVFAISNEKSEKVNPFIEQNKYTFPVYLDTQNDAGKAYGIVAIPTFAIIDKEGKLSAFFVGLQADGVIEAALKKAGLTTG